MVDGFSSVVAGRDGDVGGSSEAGGGLVIFSVAGVLDGGTVDTAASVGSLGVLSAVGIMLCATVGSFSVVTTRGSSQPDAPHGPSLTRSSSSPKKVICSS